MTNPPACTHGRPCAECLLAAQVAEAPTFDLHASCRADLDALRGRTERAEQALLAYVQAHGNMRRLSPDMVEVELFQAFMKAMVVLDLPAEWRTLTPPQGFDGNRLKA